MKVKILGLNYNIKLVKSVNIDGFYGEVKHKEELIRLNNEHTPHRMQECLIHEINHAIDAELQLKLSENTIHRLSNVWYQIIVDNPDIFEYKWKIKEIK